MFSPYGVTLWDPTSLQSSLQYAVVKSGRVVADGCEIIVGLGKMYNDMHRLTTDRIYDCGPIRLYYYNIIL